MLFVVEVLIALFVHDRFVRPYLGDTLAVVLVYCGLRAVLPVRTLGAALAAFGIAAAIEFGQAIGVLDLIGLRGNRLAEIVLGTGFEWWDFVAYAAGVLIALVVERALRPDSPSS